MQLSAKNGLKVICRSDNNVYILHAARICSNTSKKVFGWRSAVWLYFKFNCGNFIFKKLLFFGLPFVIIITVRETNHK